MPCRMDDMPSYEIQQMKAVLNDYTTAFCTACKHLEANGIPIPKEILVLWNHHKAQDKRRAAQEKKQRKEEFENLRRQFDPDFIDPDKENAKRRFEELKREFG